jgi:segregation and condensation protein A
VSGLTHDEPRESGETPPEPIYPMGPALRVPADAVQLTFLDLRAESLVPQTEEEGEEGHPGLEIKTPLGVRIPVFEGPLDLLLYLIRRDRLDIYDIPIAPITEQYLNMLGLLQVLDLEVAGDFLVMAATLMRIKARMLLPTWPEGEEDEEDPRAELVRQLLEYRQFKEAARQLQAREDERRLLYGRGFVPVVEDDVEVELEPVSHFVLIDVMKEVLSRVGEAFFYQVELEDVTLEEKMALVLGELAERGRVLFVDLVAHTARKVHIVVTFMAILELARLGRIAIGQESPFAQIWIYPVEKGRVVAAAAAEGAPEPADATPRGEDADAAR